MEYTSEQKKVIESLKRLQRNEDFQLWVDMVVKPNIEALEYELASEKADNMSAEILRGKLKHLNSLKYFFKDVFLTN